MSDAVLRLPEPVEPVPASVRTLDDQALCVIVRSSADSGEGRAAFAELYARYRAKAFAQALLMTRDASSAEDLVAETFTRVLRALSNGNGPTESVLGYVLISLRSEAIRIGQTEANLVPVAPDLIEQWFDEPVPDFSEAVSEQDQIGRAFGLLSKDARRVLWLLDVEQVSADAAGEYLDMQTGAVRVLAHRARKRLASAYLQQYVEVTNPDCAEAAGLLAEYVRGELGKRAARTVEQHLTACPHCITQASRLGDLAGQLRVWAGPVIAGGGLAGIATVSGGNATAAMAASHTAPGGVDTGQAVSLWKVVGWLGLAAGVALLIAGAFALFPRDATDTPTTPATGTTTAVTPEAADEATSRPPLAETPGAGSETVEDTDSADVPATDSPALPDPEPTVSPDDTTPNWKLAD